MLFRSRRALNVLSYQLLGIGDAVEYLAITRIAFVFERQSGMIDFVCSWGPGILGHADPRVIDKVKEACESGLSFGAPTQNEVELAKLISDLIPTMQMSRLVSSGTEAVMSAIRVARGFTKRDKIIKFRWSSL